MEVFILEMVILYVVTIITSVILARCAIKLEPAGSYTKQELTVLFVISLIPLFNVLITTFLLASSLWTTRKGEDFIVKVLSRLFGAGS